MKSLHFWLIAAYCAWLIGASHTSQAQQEPPSAIVAKTVQRADALLKEGRFADAIALLEQEQTRLSAPITTAESRAFLIAKADCHLAWAQYARQRNQFREAARQFEAAYDIDKIYRERESASELISLGNIYFLSLGMKSKALECLNKALPITQAIGDKANEATALFGLAVIFDSLGEQRKSLDVRIKALLILHTIGTKDAEAINLRSIGKIYSDLGEYANALHYYKRAISIQQTIADKEGQAITFGSMGLAYSALGEYSNSLEYSNKGLQICQRLGLRVGEAALLSNIGLVYRSLGETAKALEFFNRALLITRQVGGQRGEATILGNIGLIRAELGDFSKALGCHNAALRIFRSIGFTRGEVETLVNIGQVHCDLGEYSRALQSFTDALPILENMGDKVGEATTFTNIGWTYHLLGKYAQSLDFEQKGLRIFDSIGHKDGKVAVLRNLMALWSDPRWPSYNLCVAAYYGKQSVNLLQIMRDGIRRVDKTMQKSFVTNNDNAYRLLAQVLLSLGRQQEAVQVLNRLKQEEYLNFTRGNKEELHTTHPTLTLTQREQRAVNRMQQAGERLMEIEGRLLPLRINSVRTPEEEKQLLALSVQSEQAMQAFLVNLKQSEDEFKTSEAQSEKLAIIQDVRDLQSALRAMRPSAVTIYTLVSERQLGIILVTPENVQHRFISISAAEVRQMTEKFRYALQNPKVDPRPIGKALYANLLHPFEKELARARQLLLSLDLSIGTIPYGALYDGKKYVVQKWSTSLFTPASLKTLRASASHQNALAAGVSRGHGGVPRLPAVAAEVKAIGQKVLLDDTFTEHTWLTALQSQQWDIVHVASHFDFTGSEITSGLLLGDGKTLTLEQIKNLPAGLFDGVSLLTLSACQTAVQETDRSRRQIENFAVLAQRKGARSVMATLWSVDDKAMGILMTEFYRLWRRGMSKSEALRMVQLGMLSKSVVSGVPRSVAGPPTDDSSAPRFPTNRMAPCAHPYYWAGIIQIGNPL